jgi:hypothetical protein
LLIVRKLVTSVLLTSLLAAPVAAAPAYQSAGTRPGAFVGGRLKLPLGKHSRTKPRAELAIAPTQSQISTSGLVHTRIGEGVALAFIPKSKPALTLAGVRADAALGLRPGGRSDAQSKLGVSNAGWLAIGVGVVALAAGGYLLYLVHEADENSD